MRTVYGDLFLTKRQYIKVWAEWAETTRDNAECWGCTTSGPKTEGKIET